MAESAGGFDPYHKWLGIPPRDQPPHHYRLLGLELFETDEEVIESAASRLIAFCEQNSHGPNAAAARRVVFEIAAARLCLLDPEQRVAYDSKLKSQQAAATRSSAGVTRNPAARVPGKVDRRSTPPPRPVAPAVSSEPPPVVPPPAPMSDPFDFETEVDSRSRIGKRPKGHKPSHASSSAELDEMLSGLASTSPTVPQPQTKAARPSSVPQSPVPRSKQTAPPPPPPPGGMEDFLGSLDENPAASGSRRSRGTQPRALAAHEAKSQGKQDKKGKKKNNKSLLIVGGMALLAVLLMVVGALVFLIGGDSAVEVREKKQESGDVPLPSDKALTPDKEESTAGEEEAADKPSVEVTSVTPKTSIVAKVAASNDDETPAAPSNTLEVTESPSLRLLEICARGGSETEVKKLIAAGAELEEPDANGRTPLRLAVMGKDLPLVKALIEAKANVDTQDLEGETPLMSAVRHGDVKLVTLLLEKGADSNRATKGKQGKGGGTTPLHVAARYGRTEVAMLLIERAARIDKANQEGVTPLMVAAWKGHEETALALMEKGADVKSAVDEAGQTPLMYAARGGKIELIKAMLAEGAIVGKKSKTGSTALSIAETSSEKNEQVIAKLKQIAGQEAPDLDF